MEPVVAQLIKHIEEDENTAGQSDCESNNIYESITKVLKQVSKCNLKNIIEHRFEGLELKV
jgi:hypothetical protein